MPNGHIASSQDQRECFAVDRELIGKLVNGEYILVGLNEVLDLGFS